MRLREVVMQDSVEKMEHMPGHPLWDRGVFNMDDEYKEYKAQLQEHLQRTRARVAPSTVKEFAPQVADVLAEHMGCIEEKLDDAIAG
eukprot:jgi/Tetstr1/423752/TSEL_014383.t1